MIGLYSSSYKLLLLGLGMTMFVMPNKMESLGFVLWLLVSIGLFVFEPVWCLIWMFSVWIGVLCTAD